MTKIKNYKESLRFIFFKTGGTHYRFDHLVFGFRACFEFRASNFGFKSLKVLIY